jgi:hypothetical protein
MLTLDGGSVELQARAPLPSGKSPWYPLNSKLGGAKRLYIVQKDQATVPAPSTA